MKKIKNLAIRLAVLAIPVISLAQTPTPGTNPITAPTIGSDKRVSDFTKETLWTQIGVIINWIVALVGIVSLLCLLYGAVMYMTAGQNEENVKKGKNAVIYGIIGAIVAILAFSIFSFAKSIVT